MIVVLDTNVIISAILSPTGISSEVVRHWEVGEFEVATSTQLIKELKRAVNSNGVRDHVLLNVRHLNKLLRYYQSATVTDDPQVPMKIYKKDYAGKWVLKCASAAKARYIVTGDEYLLDIKEYEGAMILPPLGFLELLKMEGGKI